MPRFRKRPVLVNAFRYKGEFPIAIKTLEGTMTASQGDWIITGLDGELYACKDSIFRRSYEECDQAESTAFLIESKV